MKKYIIAIIFVTLIIFQACTPLYTPLYSICSQNPKEIYWITMYQWTLPENVGFSGKIRAVHNSFYIYFYAKESIMETNVKRFWINTWGFIQNKLGVKMIRDIQPQFNVVKMNNGYLTYAHPYIYIYSDKNKEVCNRYLKFKKFLDSRNIPLLFVQMPHKIHQDKRFLPRGVTDCNNEKADIFLDFLKNTNCSFYDSRTIFKNDYQSHYKLFYLGDHHWKPEYSFLAFKNIMQKVNSDFGIEFDKNVIDESLYYKKEFPFPIELQSQAKRAGKYYSQYDKSQVYLIPKFPVNVTVSVPQTKQQYQGGFESVFMPDHENRPLKKSINHNVSQGRLLLIKDSFSLPMFDYYAMAFHEVDMIDLRGFNQSVMEYIDKTPPDVVIIAYIPGYFLPGMFRFDNPNIDTSIQ